MKHDDQCEWEDRWYRITGTKSGCECSSRAYAADPLPDDRVPSAAPLIAALARQSS